MCISPPSFPWCPQDQPAVSLVPHPLLHLLPLRDSALTRPHPYPSPRWNVQSSLWLCAVGQLLSDLCLQKASTLRPTLNHVFLLEIKWKRKAGWPRCKSVFHYKLTLETFPKPQTLCAGFWGVGAGGALEVRRESQEDREEVVQVWSIPT